MKNERLNEIVEDYGDDLEEENQYEIKIYPTLKFSKYLKRRGINFQKLVDTIIVPNCMYSPTLLGKYVYIEQYNDGLIMVPILPENPNREVEDYDYWLRRVERVIQETTNYIK
jgi:hypothetical protein